MNYTPFVVAWACLAVVVVALAIFRNLAALHEDENLHLSEGEQGMVREQTAFFKVMDKLDRWGKTLTAITVVSGLALGSILLYQSLATRL